MPSTPQIVKMRRQRWKKYHHTPAQRGGLAALLLIGLVLLGVIGGFAYIYSTATKTLPSLERIPVLLEPPDGAFLQPTRFYDRTGERLIYTLKNPAIKTQTYLSVNTDRSGSQGNQLIAEHLIQATIAISDPSFWSNPGFSMEGILEDKHRTLAQRLVSDLLLWDEPPGPWRAIRERILAAQIVSLYGRERVMEWYLNSADYGSLAYGAEAAAQVYFGKPASQLTLAEAAILAGVSESPALNPLDSPQTALARGEIVLDAMEGQGLITSREATAAKNAEIRFQEEIPVQDPLALAFINFVREDLSSYIPIERVKRGGFEVVTTLDFDLQVQAACAAEIHLARISQLGTQSSQDVGVQPASGTEDCQASKLLSTIALEDGNALQDAAANVAVYDPQTGQLLALVEHPAATGENAINASQPPGSLFTPFVYLTAFTRGFNPASLVWEIPIDLADIPVEATNPDGEYEGPLRLRNAMATDTLIPAIQIIRQIGAENVLKIASQSGFATLSLDTSTEAAKECPGCQLILDDGEITLLEAVQAFGVFANQGTLVGQPSDDSTRNDLRRLRPITVLSVRDYENKAWAPETAIETRPVISTQLAYLMTNILSDEAARWPRYNHPNPLEIGRPAGAKMGLSSTGKDVWTVGYTPQLVVGVWMGLPEEEGEIRLPPKTASGLWHAVMQYAVQDQVAETWSMPPGVTEMDVCDPSGMLPTLQCPTIVREVFLTGQEPTQPDTLYQTYQVNRETNRLATVFTPPELIEERTYLNVPPEAMDWAARIGMETPPETYDLINAPDMDPDALIENPQMFDYLKGVVEIQGRAGGSDFESYRLQVGEGLNPSGWIVIQQDTFRPVEDGKLGTWVTSGLDGLYALQLIVLREDQRVDTTTIQVTLDNTPPEVSITYPNNLDTLSGTSEKTITFLVDASDNLGLEAVEYYLNGRLISTQNRPPFAYAWSSRTGRFTLAVKASDHAGNTDQAEVTFTVE